MDLFGMGPMEIIMIFAVALLVFGPERLPQVLGTVGKTLRQIRQMTDDITREVTRELNVEDSQKSSPAYQPPLAPPPVYTPPVSADAPNEAAALPEPEAGGAMDGSSTLSLEKADQPADVTTTEYLSDEPPAVAPGEPPASASDATDAAVPASLQTPTEQTQTLNSAPSEPPSLRKNDPSAGWVAYPANDGPVGFQRRGVDAVVNFDDEQRAAPNGAEPNTTREGTDAVTEQPADVPADSPTANDAAIRSSSAGERRDS